MKDKNRQLIITTIQKMATAVKKQQYAKVMELYRDEKVVFIIDECHRSQFGDMHKDIVRHFTKAQLFGFTGTPRFEVNGKVEGKVTQTTEKLFGECLHSYLIKDAIFDNNVLGFHIEYITTIKGAYDENDSTMTEAIDVGELYMADERMAMIANHIIQNHKAKTRNRQYTAIFAVSSIPMLVKYYQIFKTIDSQNYPGRNSCTSVVFDIRLQRKDYPYAELGDDQIPKRAWYSPSGFAVKRRGTGIDTVYLFTFEP